MKVIFALLVLSLLILSQNVIAQEPNLTPCQIIAVRTNPFWKQQSIIIAPGATIPRPGLCQIRSGFLIRKVTLTDGTGQFLVSLDIIARKKGFKTRFEIQQVATQEGVQTDRKAIVIYGNLRYSKSTTRPTIIYQDDRYFLYENNPNSLNSQTSQTKQKKFKKTRNVNKMRKYARFFFASSQASQKEIARLIYQDLMSQEPLLGAAFLAAFLLD